MDEEKKPNCHLLWVELSGEKDCKRRRGGEEMMWEQLFIFRLANENVYLCMCVHSNLIVQIIYHITYYIVDSIRSFPANWRAKKWNDLQSIYCWDEPIEALICSTNMWKPSKYFISCQDNTRKSRFFKRRNEVLYQKHEKQAFTAIVPKKLHVKQIKHKWRHNNMGVMAINCNCVVLKRQWRWTTMSTTDDRTRERRSNKSLLIAYPNKLLCYMHP